MSSPIPWGGGRGVFDPFSQDVWDPLAGFGSLSAWDVGRRDGGDGTTTLARTNVDWRETDNAHIFAAEIPGVRKEEVKVEVEEGNILRISGERSKEQEDKGDTWHRVERRRGQFSRRFRLPENANMEDVKCTLENGVLTVAIPKKEQQAAPRNTSC
ncbi:16.9 kDa class I heat shock protein 1 [Canna indica]|uniref:16.9 kDa class I heat shock protein 1 n=1 Tax=Canna indica TaxID=4628 RepID=A0AAQ3JMJ3_9LILI|nr:16.9 kDa class I heat shock protein 1 [Canna indica]